MAGAPDQITPRGAGRVVDRAMEEISAGARRDRHARLAPPGTPGYIDPEIFASVDALLRRAVERDEHTILFPELLDD